ncbi:MAG: DUF444 family protein, partial [Spirochaetia bacterium]|nr:DUF444 family protein [Spirochaetia bacterium]
MSSTSKSSENLSDIWKLKRRGKRDSDRHKELVKDAIRKNGKDLITEYNIITSDGDKKIKVPIRFLDQYKIKYGKLNSQDATGQGVKAGKGDKFKIKSGQPEESSGDGAGNKEGERTFDADVTIDELVDITEGYSGAQIENLLNEAMLNALRLNKTEFCYKDFDLVMNKMMAGWQPNEHEFTTDIIDHIAIHEMGHAVVGLF